MGSTHESTAAGVARKAAVVYDVRMCRNIRILRGLEPHAPPRPREIEAAKAKAKARTAKRFASAT
jgi:hypothetical protein